VIRPGHEFFSRSGGVIFCHHEIIFLNHEKKKMIRLGPELKWKGQNRLICGHIAQKQDSWTEVRGRLEKNAETLKAES
jgi:hypothetical protein